MQIDNQPDTAVLMELGQRLAQVRLDRNLTQEELATGAAVSKRTIERLEMGKSVQVSNLVRVLRALGLAANLDQLAPPVGPRPIEQLKRQSHGRRRAALPKRRTAKWSWGDDKT